LAGVVALMAILWCTQSIPLAVTSLIPLVAFPFLGIQSAGEVSKSYMNSTILLYVSGFAIAIGVERWGLHRRLALWVLSILGTGPKRVVLGFMLGTALMSMWISNTASALLMLPIALAVLASLNVQGDDQHKQAIMTKRFAVALLLGIAYSSSIGGMSTLIGTPTNGVYAGYWSSTGATAEELQRYSVSLGQWFLMFFPMSVLMFIGVWFVLCLP
ncbi:MAG TPA: anion transporter, partial [Planctomycetaceae bacterium]|nr:anion transporter [Planctomycetaceae bacterium]